MHIVAMNIYESWPLINNCKNYEKNLLDKLWKGTSGEFGDVSTLLMNWHKHMMNIIYFFDDEWIGDEKNGNDYGHGYEFLFKSFQINVFLVAKFHM